MKIETKYDVGDTVMYHITRSDYKYKLCPTCKGLKPVVDINIGAIDNFTVRYICQECRGEGKVFDNSKDHKKKIPTEFIIIAIEIISSNNNYCVDPSIKYYLKNDEHGNIEAYEGEIIAYHKELH